MHIALGQERINTAFTPQAFSNDYSVWLKNRLIYQFENRINLVENNLHKLEGLQLELANENKGWRRAAEVRVRHEMIGESEALSTVLSQIQRAAPVRSAVLIQGESGVGKELVARAIHKNSSRVSEQNGRKSSRCCKGINES